MILTCLLHIKFHQIFTKKNERTQLLNSLIVKIPRLVRKDLRRPQLTSKEPMNKPVKNKIKITLKCGDAGYADNSYGEHRNDNSTQRSIFLEQAYSPN